MKVRMNITVEVDPEAWERTYGVDMTDRKALREDVVRYCNGCVEDSAAANEGCLKVVS